MMRVSPSCGSSDFWRCRVSVRRGDRTGSLRCTLLAVLLVTTGAQAEPAPPAVNDVGSLAAAKAERHQRLSQDAFAAVAGASVVTFGVTFTAITAYSASEALAAGEDVPLMLFGIGGVAGAVGMVTLAAAGIDVLLVTLLDTTGARPLSFGGDPPAPFSIDDASARAARRSDAEIKRWVLLAAGVSAGAVSTVAGFTLLFVVLGTESLGPSGPAQTAVAAGGTLALAAGVLLVGSGLLAPFVLKSDDDIVQDVLDEARPPAGRTAPGAE